VTEVLRLLRKTNKAKRLCLIPVAARGMPGLRPLAWGYAVIISINGLAHILIFDSGAHGHCREIPAPGARVLFFAILAGGGVVADVTAAAHSARGFSIAQGNSQARINETCG
jgi:hypothetical protein